MFFQKEGDWGNCMQPSMGDEEPVAKEKRAGAGKKARQVEAQRKFEETLGASHAQLLKEEGATIREVLQEKVRQA